MFCAKCGKPLDEGTKFCLFCGAVQDAAEIELEDAPIIPETPVETNYTQAQFPEAELSADNAEEHDGENCAVREEIPETDEQNIAGASSTETVKPIKAKSVKRDRKPPMRAGFSAVICVLFSLLTLVFVFASSGLWAVRDLLQNGAVSTVVAQTNPLYLNAKDFIIDVPALERALKDSGIADVQIGEIGENETVGDVIERAMVDYGMTEDKAEQLLGKNTKLMSYLTEIVTSYEHYLLTGEDFKVITDKKLKETVLSCMDYAARELGFKFRPDYEKRLDDFFKANKDLIRAANPSEALGVGGSYIRYSFSLPVVIVVTLLAVLFAVLAGIITRRVDGAFITLGIPSLMCGVYFLYVGLFPKIVLSNAGIPTVAVGDSVETMGKVFVNIGLVETIVGLLAVAAFVIYRVAAAKISRKREHQSA